jgi:hypothetical protein
MSLPRTIRFTWQEFCVIAFLVGFVAIALHELYRAWAYHVIDIPWAGFLTARLADNPIRFAISVAFFAAGAIVVSVLLWAMAASLRREIENFRIRQRRPPLDDAGRQPPDER